MARDVRDDSQDAGHASRRIVNSRGGRDDEADQRRRAPQFGSPEYDRMRRGLADDTPASAPRRKRRLGDRDHRVAKRSSPQPRVRVADRTDAVEGAAGHRVNLRGDAAQRSTYKPDADPSASWMRRAQCVVRHSFDNVDDTQTPAISTSHYTGWRFLLNPVYCYFGFVASAVALTLLGLVMVYSSSSVELVTAGESPIAAVLQQLKFIALGLLLMVLFMINFHSRHIKNGHRVVVLVFAAIAVVLQLCLALFGIEYQGNKSWLAIAGVQFQPAELLKLALCTVLPLLVFNAQRSRDHSDLFNWFVPLVASFVVIGFVFAVSRDMGTCLILITIVLGVLIAGGIPGKMIKVGAVAIAALGTFALFLNASRISRIKMLFQGCTASDADLQGNCYQVIHGIYALSTGGIGGVGLGNSYEKWNYLPEAESDFIFAVIGEELGFVGALFVILLFALMGWCLVIMALNHPHVVGSLTLIAVFFWIIPQAVINIAVVVEMFPVTGLPLPFLSSGGSSLICCMGACGVVCYEARRIPAIRNVTSR